MAISIQCEHCGQSFKVPDSALGKKGRCPGCKAVILARPAPTEPEPAPLMGVIEPEISTAGTAPVGEPEPADDSPLSGLTSGIPQDSASDSVPHKKTKAPSQMGLRLFVLTASLIGAAYAGALGYIWNQQQLQFADTLAAAKLMVAAFAPNAPLPPEFEAFETQGKVCTYLFMAAGLGTFGGLLAFLRFRWIAVILLLAAALVPGIMLVKTLLFTGSLLIAAFFGLFIRSGRVAAGPKGKSSRPRTPRGVRLLLALLTVFGLLVFIGYTILIGYALYTASQTEIKIKGLDNAGNRPHVQRPQGAPENPLTKLTNTLSKPDEPAKEVPYAAIQKEVALAGTTSKLQKLDLGPTGLDATIMVPGGCTYKKGYDGIQITKDGHFGLKIETGLVSFVSVKENLSGQTLVANAPALYFYQQRWSTTPDFRFGLVKVLGHQDIYVRNDTSFGDKSVEHTRDECLLMLHCAQTLAIKSPPPTDAKVAITPFKQERYSRQETPGELELNEKATDVTLALLKDLPDVRVLKLRNTKITDSGVAHLKGLTQLEELYLDGHPLTDAAAKQLEGLANLQRLQFGGTRLSDEGLKSFARLPKLETLDISGGWQMKVKGPGFADLGRAPNLKVLDVSSLDLDDAAAAHLAGLKTLTSLKLNGTKILGPGLVSLKELPLLTQLDLSNTKINDAGLANLKGLENLEELDLNSTLILGPGLENLKGYKKLKILQLREAKVTDAGLAHLAGLTTLEELDLTRADITDAGLAHLKGLKALKNLGLVDTPVTDAGVKHLEGLDELEKLNLSGTKTTEKTLARKPKAPVAVSKLKPADPMAMVKKLKGNVVGGENADSPVTAVRFTGAQLTDLDLAELRDLKKLRVLHLGFNNEITDAGLVYLKGLTELEELSIEGAKLEGDGFAALAHLTKLKKLRLPRRDYSDKQLAPLATLVGLEEFDCNLSENLEGKLKILSGMTKLQRLELPRDGMSDAVMAEIAKLTGLEDLNLPSSPQWRVTDKTLAELKNLTKLKRFGMTAAAVTGDGLQALEGMSELEDLDLGDSAITDDGLKFLRKLTKIETLNLRQTGVTDEGLKQLAGLTNLKELNLSLTRTSGAGLESLKGLTSLTNLDLTGTPFTDDGMKHLSPMVGLQVLNLTQTAVTDAGLASLKGMKNLYSLTIDKTRVAGPGFAGVALPRLQALNAIDSDFGNAGLEALADMNQLGYIDLRGTAVTGEGFAKLKGLSRLNALRLEGSRLNDAGLKEIGELTTLQNLWLARTRVTDAGLTGLGNLVNLQELNLSETAVSGSGFKNLTKLKELERLVLTRTPYTTAGLENLANFPALRQLDLSATRLTDADLTKLKGPKKLQYLQLKAVPVTNAGLGHLAENLPDLEDIDAEGTLVTRDGAKALAEKRPNLNVSLGRW